MMGQRERLRVEAGTLQRAFKVSTNQLMTRFSPGGGGGGQKEGRAWARSGKQGSGVSRIAQDGSGSWARTVKLRDNCVWLMRRGARLEKGHKGGAIEALGQCHPRELQHGWENVHGRGQSRNLALVLHPRTGNDKRHTARAVVGNPGEGWVAPA